jgi:hypothetical protein
MKKAIIIFLSLIPATLLILSMFLTPDHGRMGWLDTFDSPMKDLGTHSLMNCPPDNNTSAIIRFGDGITLTGIEPVPDKVEDKISLLTGWAITGNDPRHSYSFALHVIDSQGNLVAQGDYGLPEQPFGCVPTQIDVSAIPTGNYTLRAAVYSLDTGKRLPGILLATGEQNDTLLLGQFTIAS